MIRRIKYDMHNQQERAALMDDALAGLDERRLPEACIRFAWIFPTEATRDIRELG